MRATGDSDQTRDRRLIDDRAATGLDHMRDSVLHPQEDAAQVDRDDFIEGVLAHFAQVGRLTLDAGVVV